MFRSGLKKLDSRYGLWIEADQARVGAPMRYMASEACFVTIGLLIAFVVFALLGSDLLAAMAILGAGVVVSWAMAALQPAWRWERIKARSHR